MSALDPMSLLNESLSHGTSGGSRELEHKKESENLDHLALQALDNPAKQKMINQASKKKLFDIPPENINHNATPVKNSPHNSTMVEELESKIAFLMEKLALCESMLSDQQDETYRQKWMMKVIEAAGDDLMTAAGKGFIKKKVEEIQDGQKI